MLPEIFKTWKRPTRTLNCNTVITHLIVITWCFHIRLHIFPPKTLCISTQNVCFTDTFSKWYEGSWASEERVWKVKTEITCYLENAVLIFAANRMWASTIGQLSFPFSNRSLLFRSSLHLKDIFFTTLKRNVLSSKAWCFIISYCWSTSQKHIITLFLTIALLAFLECQDVEPLTGDVSIVGVARIFILLKYAKTFLNRKTLHFAGRKLQFLCKLISI